ncbi:MAG: hypothetical protein IJ601_00640, partial [Acidaminococcaceae bacterium]|nr:hypothetical protein [Acidaminococcaceae bacterium]
KKYEQPEFAWTKEQLLYAIRNAIVNKESGVSAETQNKVANVQGKNVTLVAKGIGLNTNQETVIKASELGGGTEASIAKMKQLSNADAADVTMKDKNGHTLLFTVVDGKQVAKAYDANGKEVATDGVIDTFVIGNLSPLGVYATGKLNVTANGDNAFVAGRSNDKAGFAPVKVGQISAVGKDVRLYTQEGIYNTAVTDGELKQGSIHAKDLIAYGGTKDIGTAEKPVTVNLSGDLLSANADGNVYIKNAKSDDMLRVGSVFAKNIVSLESEKGFAMTTNKDYTLAYLNAGNILELKTNPANGVIGTAINPIRFLNNGTLISLNAKEGFIKGVNGLLGENATMKLGVIEMTGEFQATSEGNLEVGATQLEEKDKDGKVIKPSVTGKVDAGKNVKLEAAKTVVVSGPVNSAAGDISVTGKEGITLHHALTAGKLSQDANGVYSGGGSITLTSEKGSIVQNTKGDLSARKVSVTSGKAITLANTGNTFREFTAKGVDTEETDKQGNKTTVKAIGGSVDVRAHAGSNLAAGIEADTVKGNVALTNLDAGQLTVTTAVTATGDVALTAGTDVVIEDKITAPEQITVNAGRDAKETKKGALVTKEMTATVGRTADLQGDNAFARAVVKGSVPEGGKTPLISGDVKIKDSADSLSLNITSEVQGSAEAWNKTGALRVDSALTADSVTLRAKKDVRQQAGIVVTGSGEGLTVGAGTGVVLENEANKFGMLTLQGSETMETNDGEGRPVNVDAIHGDVKVKTHGGPSLTVTTTTDVSTQQMLLVGDDFAVENLDADGGISMLNSIWAYGENEGTGNITLKADGDIVNGDDTHEVMLIANRDIHLISAKGLIDNNGSLAAWKDVTLEAARGISAGENDDDSVYADGNILMHTAEGRIEVAGIANALNGDVIATVDKAGDIQFSGDVDAGNDIIATTSTGNIVMEEEVTAGRDIIAKSKTGNIGLLGDIDAGRDVTVSTGKNGLIRLNGEEHDTNNVHAGRDVNLTAENSGISVSGIVTADTGSVNARTTDGSIEFVGDVNAGRDIEATVLEGRDGTHIRYAGTTIAGNNVIANAKLGNIQYDRDVEAGNIVEAHTDRGDIVYDANVTAGNSVLGYTIDGDITVGKDIVAQQGDVLLDTGKGSVVIGKAGGTGNVKADGDVSISTLQGDVAVKTSVTSDNGSVSVKSQQGNIDIGEISVGNAISARENIDLYVADGVITVTGKTETTHGDITVTALDDDTLQNLVIEQNGKLISGRNLTLKTYNGDIQVTDRTAAKQDLTVDIGNKGNIAFGVDVTVLGNIDMSTGDGDIFVGKDLTAGGKTNLITGSGDIVVGYSGNGDINAGEDITIRTGSGKIDVIKTVVSDNGSVSITNKNGDILIGSNGVDEETIAAKQNITLNAENGVISVFGKTETKEGDIKVRAWDEGEEPDIVINQNGKLISGRDLKLEAYNGDIQVTDRTVAKRNLAVDIENSGNITFGVDVTVLGNIDMSTGAGDIFVGKDLTAGGKTNLTAGSGDIVVGYNGNGNVKADKDITVQTGSGKIDVIKTVVSDNGSVSVTNKNGDILIGSNGVDEETIAAKQNITLNAENGVVSVFGKTETKEGDIKVRAWNTEDDQNIVIDHEGKLISSRDLTLEAYNGDIEVTDDTVAKRKLAVNIANKGSIAFGVDVTVDGDIAMATNNGNILVGKDITAGGSVDIKAKTGSVAVGYSAYEDFENNTESTGGKITAGNNVNLDVTTGNVDIKKSVTSRNGSVTAKTGEGTVRIGNNGADVETVTANKNVTLESGNGKVEVYGKTSTATGDIRVKAANPEYTKGEDGKNIIIAQNGKLESGKDAYLTAKNGDLEVTNDVTAKGTFYARTEGQGNITLGENLTVQKDLSMKTETGNITVGNTVTADQGSVTMTAGEGTIDIGKAVKAGTDVTATTGNGSIIIGNNGPDEETVAAKRNITLSADNGVVSVYGKTETEAGDIKVRAWSEKDGQNIVIDQNGQLISGRDLTMEA